MVFTERLMKKLMKKATAILLLIMFANGCNKHYYLMVDECYMHKDLKNYGEIYSAFTMLIAQHDLYLIFDKLDHGISFDRDNISLYVNNEKYSDFIISAYTNNKRIDESIISVEEGFIDLAVIFDVTLPSLYGTGKSDSVSVKVEVENITYYDSNGDYSKESFEYYFTYYSIHNDKMENAKIRRGNTWWRNPGVDICLKEDNS